MNHRRIVLLLFCGSLLLQLAWIISLPPFRGIDEFDHAYRASAVAHGQWIADPNPVVDGRGNLVVASRSIVVAARPECYAYVYTEWADCNPVSNAGRGYVTVSSAAARYNPLFYWIIGTPAKFFQGATSLEVMRLTASLLCSLMIGAIGWIITLWARTIWPIFGLVVGLTPMVMFSSILPAPNGVEMLGGLGLWAALLGLPRVAGDASRERRLIWAAATAAAPLAFVRSLGPMWLAMIVLTICLYMGWRNTWALVARNRRSWTLASISVVTTTLAGGAWTVLARTNAPSDNILGPFPNATTSSLLQLIVWPFQSFAAFPTRGEMAPLFTYPLGFLVFGFFLLGAFRLSTRRAGGLLASVTVASLAVPLVITLSTYTKLGAAWQGRYTLPYSLGLVLIAGVVLDGSARRPRLSFAAVLFGFVLYTAAHLGGTIHVLHHESLKSPLAGTSEWWIPPTWLVGFLIVGGMGAWFAALRTFHPSDECSREVNLPEFVGQVRGT